VSSLINDTIQSVNPSVTVDSQVSALCLMSDVWLSYCNSLAPEMSTEILSCMRRNAKHDNLTIQLISIGNLMNVLESFSVNHHPFAPYVYKVETILS
jgi:hypothetical protein